MITKDFEFTLKVRATSEEDISDETLQNGIKYELDRCLEDHDIYVNDDEGEYEVNIRSVVHFMQIKSKRI